MRCLFDVFGVMDVESAVEIDSSIPKVILPFGSQPVVPKVFIIPIIETIDVGLSIGQDVSFDVMLRFVSRIYDDVPTVSSMNMSCFEYFPMCYDCVYDYSLSLSQHPSISHVFDINDEP